MNAHEMKDFQLIHYWKILGIYRIIYNDVVSDIWSFRSRIDRHLDSSDLQEWFSIAFRWNRLFPPWCVRSAGSTILFIQRIITFFKQLLIWLASVWWLCNHSWYKHCGFQPKSTIRNAAILFNWQLHLACIYIVGILLQMRGHQSVFTK